MFFLVKHGIEVPAKFQMLNTADVAELLCTSHATVGKYAALGILPNPVKFKRSNVWPKEEIFNLVLNKCEQKC